MHHMDDEVAADLPYCCKNLGKANTLGKTACVQSRGTGACVISPVVCIINSPGQMPAVPSHLDLRHAPIDEQLNAGDETAVI